MTKSYAQLVKEIEGLQVAADKARKKEVDGVIARIREAISVYELTPDDLGFGAVAAAKKSVAKKAAGPSTAKPKKSPKAKSAPVVKFRNESGGTWGGLGKRPQWLRDALAEGKTLADFAVQ